MKTNEMTRLFVDDGGKMNEKLPVVFLHSLAGNTQQWAAQLRHVRQTRRAIALDLPGHGQSTRANANFSIESMAEAVHVTLAELDIERFILVGHSMAGSVAVAYAGAYPQQVAGLLLVDPSGDSTQLPAEQVEGILAAIRSLESGFVIAEYWDQIVTGATEETKAQVLADLKQTELATVAGVMQELFRYNPLPALQAYMGPRLSVITPINQVPTALHNIVPDLPHRLVEVTSHWLHLDKPKQFNKILDEFVYEIES